MAIARWIPTWDFVNYAPIEYPFVLIPVMHMDCLICKSRKHALDFQSNKHRWECPLCHAQIPKNLWQRIFSFVREGV